MTSLTTPGLSRPAASVRRIAFRNVHTGEALSSVYWEDGNYVQEALVEIDFVLRDHRNDEIKSIDVGLLDLLSDLRLELESTASFEVISGYRSPATNAMLASRSNGVAKKSLHMKGKAIDLALPGMALRQVRDRAIRLRRGGVGFYPGSGFVHLDVGRPRQW